MPGPMRGPMPGAMRNERMSAAISPMQYRPAPEAAASGVNLSSGAQPAELIAHWRARARELEQKLEARASAYNSQLEQACREAGDAARAEAQIAQASAMDSLANAIGEFARARDRYLADVEQEVVKLALAIAARILRREAQIDPLLLLAPVREALGELSQATDVKLRVPAAEKELWSERLSRLPNLPIYPEIVADAQLDAAECRVEAALGSADLGVKSQLTEIERGLFDLPV